MTLINLKKLFTKDPKRIFVYGVIILLIGYLACPLSVQLGPVDWWSEYPMIWYSDDFTSDRYTKDAEAYFDVESTDEGLIGTGELGKLYGGLRYVFKTEWSMEKGRLGVMAESGSQSCYIEVIIDDHQAGVFNGSKEMLFCTAENVPSENDPRQWTVIKDPKQIEIQLIFHTALTNSPKDLVVKVMEFSAKVKKPSSPQDNGTLFGYVYDITSNHPLQGVTVQISEFSTVTNQEGFFRIQNIKPDTYIVKFTKSGYKEREGAVTIKASGESEFHAYLEPVGISTPVNGSLEGYITDADTGKPIEDANVMLNHALVTKYQNFTDSKGYYHMDNIQPGVYDFLCLAVDHAPHHNWDYEVGGPQRYDVEMGEGVSYPVLPGRGMTETEEGESEYKYYPPAPPDYPTYIPPVRETAPSNYPVQGPVYQNPTATAPSDGANYVPPPPAYRQSSNLPGSGYSAPRTASNPVEQAIRGWQSIANKIKEWYRRVTQ